MERARILLLDLLETIGRERDARIRLERLGREAWRCELHSNGDGRLISAIGPNAREAIRKALESAGVDLPP